MEVVTCVIKKIYFHRAASPFVYVEIQYHFSFLYCKKYWVLANQKIFQPQYIFQGLEYIFSYKNEKQYWVFTYMKGSHHDENIFFIYFLCVHQKCKVQFINAMNVTVIVYQTYIHRSKANDISF